MPSSTPLFEPPTTRRRPTLHQAGSLVIARSIMVLARLRGGGSVLPGLVMENIDPGFLERVLTPLPRGVVVISGTNGKTTTTRLVTQMLRDAGLRVFTNASGSNLTRGITASLVASVDRRGELAADIAVLELDEAHASHFIKRVPPRYCLLLNVSRDQLDRYGEIDDVVNALRRLADSAKDAIVLNASDQQLGSEEFSAGLRSPRVLFGCSDGLLPQGEERAPQPLSGIPYQAHLDVVLEKWVENRFSYRIGDERVTTSLGLTGSMNGMDVAGAVALVRTVLKRNIEARRLLDSAALVTPTAGRGETFSLGGDICELFLVKNPRSFEAALQSHRSGMETMIAINDGWADGRDTSWLWDVSLEPLTTSTMRVVTGDRGEDMRLRLLYDDIDVEASTEDLGKALDLLAHGRPEAPKRIYANYTAMMQIRRLLIRRGIVSRTEQVNVA